MMSTRQPDYPSQEHVRDASALGSLHLLGDALEIAQHVLVAAHPEIRDREDRAAPPARQMARAMLPLLRGLRTLLTEYRIALLEQALTKREPASVPPEGDDDDIPW
jgi:hypothetical protein